MTAGLNTSRAMAPQPACIAYDARRDRLTLTVHVQPGAKSSALAGLHGDAVKIRIAAPAVDNKANAALIAFLAAALGLQPARLRLRQGSKSRRKVVEFADAGVGLAQRLRAMLPPQ